MSVRIEVELDDGTADELLFLAGELGIPQPELAAKLIAAAIEQGWLAVREYEKNAEPEDAP